MIIKGEIETKNCKTRLDLLKRYGIIKQTKSNGNFCFTPLGKIFKDRVLSLLRQELLNYHYYEIQLPNILKTKGNSKVKHKNTTLFSNNNIFSCDALEDAIEASNFIENYDGVFWEKSYIDTSRRIKSTSLRFHSYGLICSVSKESSAELCEKMLEILKKVLFNMKEKLYIEKKHKNGFSVEIDIDNEKYTIAHIHNIDGYDFSVSGISIEKIVYSILKFNKLNSNKRTNFFQRVLMVYKNKVEVKEGDYDFVDARNCKITEKVELLTTIGVEKIFLLNNSGKIKEYKKQ